MAFFMDHLTFLLAENANHGQYRKNRIFFYQKIIDFIF